MVAFGYKLQFTLFPNRWRKIVCKKSWKTYGIPFIFMTDEHKLFLKSYTSFQNAVI